jgi:hypothetical protein
LAARNISFSKSVGTNLLLAIQEIGGFDCEISGIPAGLSTPAQRPEYSLLDKSKIKASFEYLFQIIRKV